MLAGDHCKEASDLGLPLRRHRLHVPAGLLPPERVVRGLAGRALPTAELGGRADRAGASRPTASRASSPCRSASAPCWSRCGTPSSDTRISTCSTPISRRTRRGIASSPRGSTAATARRASSRKSSSASAASARVRALGLDPVGVAPQRGPRRLRRPAAHPRVPRARALVRATRSSTSGRSTVFTTHTPVPGRARRLPLPPGRDAPRRLLGPPRRSPRGLPGPRPPRQRPRHAVQHDGAGAALGELRQRRQPAAWRGDARDVGAVLRREPADQVPVAAITNGVHLGTWVAADMARLFDRYLDSHWRERCDDPAIWERVLAIPDRSCGSSAAMLRRFLITFVRERARERWMQERVSAGARRRRRHAALARRADHRLRAPLRHLQARRADLPRSGAAGAHPQQPAPAGPDHLRRQGASRPTTAASACCRTSTAAPAIRRSAAASPSSTTTTCTSRTTSCRAATSG